MCSRPTITLMLTLLIHRTTKRAMILRVSRVERDWSSRSPIALHFGRASFSLRYHCRQWKQRS
ncbi:hypothetical protein ACHAWF_006864 [Thalassiosira exigua]